MFLKMVQMTDSAFQRKSSGLEQRMKERGGTGAMALVHPTGGTALEIRAKVAFGVRAFQKAEDL